MNQFCSRIEFRRSLAILLSVCLAPFAGGQVNSSEDETIEEVVVTGSHLKSTPADAPLPVTTVTRDELILEGSPTTIDLIKQLSFSQGADGETDQFQAGAGADRATINIRGLGPSRSLVLVNGHRTTWSPHAIGAQAQLLVDVNSLPSMALERVEVLRDGAAATYGSDAIAGVMNYITRSDFEGAEFSFNHKSIDGSDGDTELGAIWGGAIMNGKANLVTSVSYINRSDLPLVSREWAVQDYASSPLGGWSSVGRPAVMVPSAAYGSLPASLRGFTGLLLTGVVDPSCETLGGTRTTVLPQNPLGGFCRFQYTAFDNLAEEATRWQSFTEFTTDLGNDKVLNISFLHSDSEVPNWQTSPSYPPNRLVDPGRTVRANNPGLVDLARQFRDDPTYGPVYGSLASCGESFCNYAGDEWDEVAWLYGRFYGQDGPLRSHARLNSLTRIYADLSGSRENFDWEINGSFSTSHRESYGGDTSVYRDARGREGLAGHECERQVPNEYDENGNLSFSLDTLRRHAGQGACSYWIPFSNGMWGSHPQVPNGVANNPTFNPGLDNRNIVDYMVTGLGSDGDTTLFVLEGKISGETAIGNLDAAYALGGQIRSETYKSGPLEGALNDGIRYPCQAGPEIKNCTTSRTGLFGFLPPSFPIDEKRSISSVFAELDVPLTHSLEANATLRIENYGSDTGTSIDPKVALRYQIFDGLSARASVGTTFRGPTLNQIVAENSSNSLQYVGVTQAFKRIDTRGNPSLSPETATTVNAGLIFDESIQGINFFATADYWSYDFEKPLVTEPFGRILAAACPDGVSDPCDESSPYFDRIVFAGTAAAANVEIINIDIVNGPDIKTTGIDYSMRADLPIGGAIASLGVNATNILSYDISAWELGEEIDALGRLNYTTSLARTLAEWKGSVFLNWAVDDWNVRLTGNYIDSYLYSTGGPDRTVDSHLTWNLGANWQTPQEGLTVWGTVINISDDDPPFMGREMNYDAFSHNPFGRIIKFGATVSF